MLQNFYKLLLTKNANKRTLKNKNKNVEKTIITLILIYMLNSIKNYMG